MLAVAVMVYAPSDTHAQQTDFEGWFSYVANVGIEPERKWVLTLEEQPRQGDNWRRLNTNILRLVLSRAGPGGSTFGVGYLWGPMFYNSEYHRTYRDENRTFLQATYVHHLDDVLVQHRFRQEQRFIQDTQGAVSNRARYLIRASYPLVYDGSFGIAAFNEIFVNFNSVPNGPTGGYDQDRIFIGPFWKVGNARYDVGFLEQHTQRFGLEPRWAQVFVVSVSVDY